jgi:hypothetical protein
MNDENLSKDQALKIKIADVIIGLNECETMIKNIISGYIDSKKQSHFVSEILLNNSIVSFGTKIKLLHFIVKTEQIEIGKDFRNALLVIISKRNMLAHSDSLLMDFDFEVTDVEDPTDYFSEDELLRNAYLNNRISTVKVTEVAPKAISITGDGSVNYEEVEKTIADFMKYKKIVTEDLLNIIGFLFTKRFAEENKKD